MTSKPQLMEEMMSDAKTIAFIGGGQMAIALASGFCKAGHIHPSQIRVAEPKDEARERFASQLPGSLFATNHDAAADADIVFLAVKPQQTAKACSEIRGCLNSDTVLVSIVAGLSMQALSTIVDTKKIIRVMPNTPCLIGRGVSAMCRSAAVSDECFQWTCDLMGAVGTVHPIDESLMDAVTGLSGSGPGYIAMVVEALADGGIQAGLPKEIALALATETLSATASLLEQTGEHPAEIRKRVCSPGGTTLAGLATMEQDGVNRGIAAGVVAAANRARELGST